MYEEIIRELMKWDMILMAFFVLLFLVLPFSIYVYVLIKNKKKRQKKKNKAPQKKWNKKLETAEEKALAFVIVGLFFFCLTFGMTLYEYLSLREDMIAENYVTYAGEFKCRSSRSKYSTTTYVEWTNENGGTESVEYKSHIDRFQENGKTLLNGNYEGTIVYSPSGDVLLWWDAVPIGE